MIASYNLSKVKLNNITFVPTFKKKITMHNS